MFRVFVIQGLLYPKMSKVTYSGQALRFIGFAVWRTQLGRNFETVMDGWMDGWMDGIDGLPERR